MDLQEHILQAATQSGCPDLEELASLLAEARERQHSLIDTALDSTLVAEETFLHRLSESLHFNWCDQLKSSDPQELRKICSAKLALRHRIFPLAMENGREEGPYKGVVRFATYDPFDLATRQAASNALPYEIEWQMASRRRILQGLQDLYGVGADTFEQLLAGLESDGESLDILEEANVLDEEEDEEATVVKFVNQIIREGLTQRATDIHVEPLHQQLRIRYRIDGVLQEVPVPENIKALQSSVISRLKIMARLDIAEKRLPQDGRINLKIEGHSIDVRVATVPTVEGESVSLRLLGQERFTMDRLQMLPNLRKNVEHLLGMSNGIVLLTGPTGCGKSTTLYTFLTKLNTPNRRIVTVEDPVENKIEGVMQIAVKPEINLTFASGLRSILRSDPNVVMIGEIRDLETAEIAIRSALTGHLVFSTLHTNDAVSGITRLTDMGVEPFLVGAAVRAFIAQRLVRTLCPNCKKPASFPDNYLDQFQFPREGRDQLFQAVGCDHCRGTGYHGRMAIYELCRVSTAMQDLIVAHESTKVLRQKAQKEGMFTLRDYGWLKAVEGETTIEEVVRVTSTEVEIPEQ